MAGGGGGVWWRKEWKGWQARRWIIVIVWGRKVRQMDKWMVRERTAFGEGMLGVGEGGEDCGEE